ncbi:hypothetical protein QR98_0101620 [Sarcoptes scabiei]|uniref:Uncharacterized protein n=1 Tax=Sarcoptes scabiei TaxID=52283 RepID=A0A132AL64_SARSC|nr:hypothetical protein QR98_0101620 [Sarcoptes scabiei]
MNGGGGGVADCCRNNFGVNGIVSIDVCVCGDFLVGDSGDEKFDGLLVDDLRRLLELIDGVLERIVSEIGDLNTFGGANSAGTGDGEVDDSIGNGE